MDNEYYLYDQVLLGKKRTCGKELFESTINGRKEYNPADEERSIKIIKYALEYYLGWSPVQIWENINMEVLEKMKLGSLVNQRIKYPVELLDEEENLKYLVCRMYPGLYHYHPEQAVANYYDRVLAGEIKRFKKGFFSKDDNSGKDRAAICLRRALEIDGRFGSREEMYDYFCRSEGRQFISTHKLGSACRDLFEFPVCFLHYAVFPLTPKEERSHFQFYYYKCYFNEVNEKQKRRYRKDGMFIA